MISKLPPALPTAVWLQYDDDIEFIQENIDDHGWSGFETGSVVDFQGRPAWLRLAGRHKVRGKEIEMPAAFYWYRDGVMFRLRGDRLSESEFRRIAESVR